MQSQTQQYTAHITQAADSKEERLKAQETKAAKLSNRESAKGSISAGIAGIGTGIWDGLSGAVLKPIKGAQEGGVGGFLKGVGDGAVGVVTKPSAGVINAGQHIVKVSENLIKSAETFERLRVPRAVFGDHILRTYDPSDARAYWEMYTNEVRLRKEGKIAAADELLEKRRCWVGTLENVPSMPSIDKCIAKSRDVNEQTCKGATCKRAT
jgi:vacuolar protein sorting-associated protein 13A/C